MRAFKHLDGSPKTHARPRICKECRKWVGCGCFLPFRVDRKLKQLYKKYVMPIIRKDIQANRMRR